MLRRSIAVTTTKAIRGIPSSCSRRFICAGTAKVAADVCACKQITCNLGAHFGTIGDAATFTCASTLLASPVGTLAMAILAYNVCIVGAKHLFYTVEQVNRDYTQDVLTQVWIRYALFLSILIGCSMLLIEP